MNERPTGRRATNAGRSTGRAQRPATLRAPAPEAQKNKMLIIWGCVGGGVVLILLIALMAGGGGENGESSRSKVKGTGPKADALRKCEQGANTCKAAFKKLAGASGDEKERLRSEIERGFKTVDEGLAEYRKAGGEGGAGAWERARAEVVERWAADLEGEASRSINEGVSVLQGMTSLMGADTESLSDRERTELVEGLRKGKKLIDHGRALNSRSYEVTGHTFDEAYYGNLYTAVKKKLLELQ